MVFQSKSYPPLDRVGILESYTRIQTGTFDAWIATVRSYEDGSAETLKAVLAKYRKLRDDEALEAWLSDGDDFAWHQANAFVVMLYHFVEGTLKRALKLLGRGVSGAKIEEVLNKLEAGSIFPRGMEHFATINLLREITNSLKHSSGSIKDSLRLALGLNEATFGHIESGDLRVALMERLKLPEGAKAATLMKRLLGHVRTFLKALYTQLRRAVCDRNFLKCLNQVIDAADGMKPRFGGPENIKGLLLALGMDLEASRIPDSKAAKKMRYELGQDLSKAAGFWRVFETIKDVDPKGELTRELAEIRARLARRRTRLASRK